MCKKLQTLFVLLLMAYGLFAHINPDKRPKRSETTTNISFRSDCNPAKARYDQAINNVRARLTTGGDVWWNGGEGRYVVPKVPPGVPEVSSIFAGAVWLGGVDEGGNLKVAAQTYGRSTSEFDFYAGPLSEGLDSLGAGQTNQQTCADWDKLFVVKASEIDEHLRRYGEYISGGDIYVEEDIPVGVLGWPGKGNPYFFDVHGFDLPPAQLGLAGFFDDDGDGLYNPLNGDYPIIEIRGCDAPQYPDEMVFWVYNDNGNIHLETQAAPIQMEVQVQAFAYATNDQLNDMTFQRYKLINRAIEPIDSTFFAMWVDPDLGCFSDDYVGCDVERSMAYVYNEDALDGSTGCNCGEGVVPYCDEVPILGVDYFRGPRAPKVFRDSMLVDPMPGEQGDTTVELGMSSFTYYNRGGDGFPPGTTDPEGAQEYYNYLTGSWRDGSSFEYGGDGYQEGTFAVNYAFPDAPNDPQGWSMCTGEDGGPVATGGDRRTIQATGPFRLDPGAVNELIVGVVWVPDQDYPCPSIRALQEADDLSQALFDNCFDLPTGPDAPDIDIIELDQELILVLSNDTLPTLSNNAFEEYMEPGLEIPPTAQDSFYRFEGYRIYQVAGPNIGLTPENLEDPQKVRPIFQVDLQNNVSRIFNWNTLAADENPTGEEYFEPVLKVDGANEGILHTFRVTDDAFAESDRQLVNHKKYYFVAVAYAFNEYEPFDPDIVVGQKQPYLEGRRNIGPNSDGLPYTAIPRPIGDRKLNADYGDGAIITRLDGEGTGNNFLDLSDETKAALEGAFANQESYDGDLTYASGAGPISIKVFNPLEVKDGNFELRFVDSNPEDEMLDQQARWVLIDLDNPGVEIASEKTIERLNEQIIKEFGFAVIIGQEEEPGAAADQRNGFIGYDLAVEGDGEEWLAYVQEGFDPTFSPNDDAIFDFLSTLPGEEDADLDPDGGLSRFGNFAFMPYYLLDYTSRNDFDPPFLGPVMTNVTASNFARQNSGLEVLNNVDIVFTSNKDLWSRCAIVETANDFYGDVPGYEPEPFIFDGEEVPAQMFDLRPEPSVGKEAGPNGLPLPDGETATVEGETFDLYGYGWFPGYAVDVETGQRLNIFFGENSIYNGDTLFSFYSEPATGGDMMFNPTSELVLNGANYNQQPIPFVFGGQHYVYVTRQPYDGCMSLLEDLYRPKENWAPLRKINGLSEITWAGAIMMRLDTRMNSYEAGLIPADTRVKLRVANAYQVEKDYEEQSGDQRTGTGDNNYHPLYQFSIEGRQAEALSAEGVESALDLVNVVPNPYYAFSEYETSQFSTTVKITNLPAQCTVTIYTLDGKFIRQYTRDEIGSIPEGNNRAIDRNQIIPDLEWDLRNNKLIPISSGVYLIHVEAPGLGERTLKWFGINRKFDPSGL